MAQRPPYPHPSSAAVSAVMRANLKNKTAPEVRLRSLLHVQGFRFRKNFLVQTPTIRVRPDIVFTRKRIAVFVDGCFWHQCPEHGNFPKVNTEYWVPKLQRNVERDRLVVEGLREAGWTVLRIWEHVPVEQAAERVAHALTHAEVLNSPKLSAP